MGFIFFSMGRRQRGSGLLSNLKKGAIGALANPVINKIAGTTLTKIKTLINKKVKNKHARGLLQNQLNAAIPYMKGAVKEVIKEQSGGRRRKRQRYP